MLLINDAAVSVKPSTTGSYFSCVPFKNKIQCYQLKQSLLVTPYNKDWKRVCVGFFE
jgi:hypothetical protein